MTNRIFITDDEQIARALFEPQWDESVKRGSPGCFTKNNTSVTRCYGKDISHVIGLLKGDVEKPGVTVKAVGLIFVSTIKDIGLALDDESKIFFEVESSPTEKNDAHAEIIPFIDQGRASVKKNVPRSVSRDLNDSLKVLVLDADGDVLEEVQPKKA